MPFRVNLKKGSSLAIVQYPLPTEDSSTLQSLALDGTIDGLVCYTMICMYVCCIVMKFQYPFRPWTSTWLEKGESLDNGKVS
jgi:hypothetical protein